jgi:nucleotide-binding universal stress UspA family protein
MFERILVGFDGSEGAVSALRTAAGLAKLCGADLMVLTVFRHHGLLEGSFSVARPGDDGNLDDVSRGHAREVAEAGKAMAHEAGVDRAHAFIKPGQPARTLVAFGEERKADLIVVGSRGLGSVEQFLLGSVSHKVSGLADCPVLVV